MPSKAELQKQITELKESLKGATQRLAKTEALPSGEKHYLPMPRRDLCILNVEKAIGSNTSWDIEHNLYERKTAGEDSCLPCEEEYYHLRTSIDAIGSAYQALPIKSWAEDEEVTGQVKQQLARELFAVEQSARHTESSCGVNLSGVKDKEKSLRGIAHIGRWEEFMKGKEQLIIALEQDLKASIPNISITRPIRHAVPEAAKPPKREIGIVEPGTQLYLLQTIEETKRMAKEAEKAAVKPRVWKLAPPKVTITRTSSGGK